MEKYRCLNGEIVEVEYCPSDNSKIIVHYKNKKYIRSKSIIGSKIFKISKASRNGSIVIDVDCTVRLQEQSGAEITVRISDVKPQITYKRMVGSYYTTSTEITYVGERLGTDEGVTWISTQSPLGKAMIGCRKGDTVFVSLPEDKGVKYTILDVKK